MPVSGHFHWSTFVVCNLDVLLARCFGGSAAADDRVPCMLHLDSLGGIHVTSIIADICRKNIVDEWRAVCAPRILAAPSAEQTAVQRQCDIIAAQLRRLPAALMCHTNQILSISVFTTSLLLRTSRFGILL